MWVCHATKMCNLDSIATKDGLIIGGPSGQLRGKRTKRHQNHFGECHPDEHAPQACQGKEVLTWWNTSLLVNAGWSFGQASNGVWVCGEDFQTRFSAGARHASSQRWILRWHGSEHGGDPNPGPPVAHRCPEASSSQDEHGDAWQTYFSNRPIDDFTANRVNLPSTAPCDAATPNAGVAAGGADTISCAH